MDDLANGRVAWGILDCRGDRQVEPEGSQGGRGEVVPSHGQYTCVQKQLVHKAPHFRVPGVCCLVLITPDSSLAPPSCSSKA